MRQAFLIIAHNNWWQLKQLLQLLDDENHDLYVHIDKKSKDFKKEYFEGVTKKSKITFFQEYEVYWGGFSQVEVEMFLFKKAHAGKYDYYHLISGVDLPLKKNAEIDSFFEKNKGKQFIYYDEEKLKTDPEITRRTKYYHFLQNYRRRFSKKYLNVLFTFLERILLVLQIVLHVNRVRKLDWTVKYGSNWVSITDDLVTALIKNEDKIRKVFSCTNCADELFVQTIAYNCGFQEQIYEDEKNQTSNMRYIDWARGKNGNPYTFTREDKKVLLNCNALFARKFSEKTDRKIIEEIVETLRENR